METKIYAAYGSNTNLAQMKKHCPKAKVVGTGELPGYKLTFRGRNAGFVNVEVDDTESVPIVLWAITKECEIELDRYEGYPKFYKKEVVTIKTANGAQTAMLYAMNKSYDGIPAMPTDNYFEIIRQGYEDNGIHTEYLTKVLKMMQDEIAKQ